MQVKTLLLALLLMSVTTAAVAQGSQEPSAGMQDLEFLVGSWQGEGWIMSEEGRIPLTSTELVQWKLDGNALLVEGIHRGTSPAREEDAVLFEALALVTYDAESGKYLWRSATSEGRGGNFDAEFVGDETFHWGREGGFRYIIKIDENRRWHEIGESTRDGGETWHQFFEMTLERHE